MCHVRPRLDEHQTLVFCIALVRLQYDGCRLAQFADRMLLALYPHAKVQHRSQWPLLEAGNEPHFEYRPGKVRHVHKLVAQRGSITSLLMKKY